LFPISGAPWCARNPARARDQLRLDARHRDAPLATAMTRKSVTDICWQPLHEAIARFST
jgi:hypothetical protein